jgi:hypothetical protein
MDVSGTYLLFWHVSVLKERHQEICMNQFKIVALYYVLKPDSPFVITYNFSFHCCIVMGDISYSNNCMNFFGGWGDVEDNSKCCKFSVTKHQMFYFI